MTLTKGESGVAQITKTRFEGHAAHKHTPIHDPITSRKQAVETHDV